MINTCKKPVAQWRHETTDVHLAIWVPLLKLDDVNLAIELPMQSSYVSEMLLSESRFACSILRHPEPPP